MSVGETIKQLRKSKNLTQQELGDILGVKKASIQKYESGSIVNLKLDTIEKLAEVFEVTPSYIMGWDKFDNKYNVKILSSEVSFIEEINKRFGFIGVEFYNTIVNMNDDGRRKVLFYAEDIKDSYRRD